MFAGVKSGSFVFWGVTPAALIVALLWYQFGFSMGGVLEEWDFLWLLASHPTFWNSFPGNLMSEMFAARPFQVLPFWLAHLISSNSFLGFNLLLMTACFCRVIAGAWIGFFLFRNRSYAAACGLLFFIFPADTQQLAFRTINVSCAVAFMTAGVAIALKALTIDQLRRQLILIVLSNFLCVIGTWIYEPVLTLYALPVLLIWARFGVKATFDVIKRQKIVALVWCIAPLISAAYLYYAMMIFGSAYQVNAAHGSMLKSIAANGAYLFRSLAYRVFIDSWISAWTIATTQIVHYKFIVLSCILVAALILMLSRRENAELEVKRRIRIIVSGLFAMIAGYLPYMVDPYHMEITQRTFIDVAPGAAMVLIGLIALITQRRLIVGAAISCVFILLSVISQLYQFDQYARDYTGITLPYMSYVADKVDRAKPVHLIIDSSGFGAHLMGMYESKITTGIAVRAADVDGKYILCIDQPPTPYSAFFNCTFRNGVWTVSAAGHSTEYPATKTQRIDVGASLNESYRSNSTTWKDQGSFVRTKSMFKTEGGADYSCRPDSMWGWSGFCRGEGWSDGIFSHASFRHLNFMGTVAPTASLIFYLTPSSSNYRLTVTMYSAIDDAIVPAMKIIVNGKNYPYQVSGLLTVDAIVPASALKSGQNEIRFENVRPVGRDVGMLVSRIDLKPRP